VMDYFTFSLPNGIKVIFKPVDSKIAHVGLFINAGSRDEAESEHGLAHFIEHVLFKGTTKRKSHHIISRLEDVGGELNAYTTKEETCIHASFMEEYIDRTLELISDIAFNATFPEKEIEKEKAVIIDEINSYKDNPSELIFDEYDEMLFPKQTLGRSILGTPNKLKKFKREHLLKFVHEKYYTNEMVICIIGNYKKDKLFWLVEKYFKSVMVTSRKVKRITAKSGKPFSTILTKDNFQSHCIIGSESFGFNDTRRLTLHLLNNILGGPGMNSRLNMSLRERHGCTYNIDSSYTPFFDTGIFSVYFGTDKENVEKCIKLVHKEFDLLKNNKLSTLQLSKAKKQLIGQLAIGSEHNENLMLTMGKSYMVFNKVDTLEEINQQIEAISTNNLLEVANDVLDTKKLSMLVYT
jgi:predicted Zn-dependent peptidase